MWLELVNGGRLETVPDDRPYAHLSEPLGPSIVKYDKPLLDSHQFIREGWRMVDVMEKDINGGPVPSAERKPIYPDRSLPAQFCCEVSAIYTQYQLESAGLLSMLGIRLPPVREAWAFLRSRMRLPPRAFFEYHDCLGPIFIRLVIGFTNINRQLERSSDLQCGMVIGAADNLTLVEAIADFVWKHRRIADPA
jgi:hypothetical protein